MKKRFNLKSQISQIIYECFLTIYVKVQNDFYSIFVERYQWIPSFSCKCSLTSAEIWPSSPLQCTVREDPALGNKITYNHSTVS